MNYGWLLLLPALGACSSSTSQSTPGAANSGTAPAVASTGAAVDAQGGFMGHRFGDALATFPGLERTPVQQVHPGVMYAPPLAPTPTKFGPAILTFVRHFFLNGKYYRTTVEAPGEQAPKFLAEARRRYGPGQEADGGKQVWWLGEHVVATAQLANPGYDQVLSFTIYDKQAKEQAELPD